MADYVRKATIEVKAQQFFVAVLPWPAGVREDPQGAGHYLSLPEGPLTIRDGEWVVIDEFGKTLILDGATLAKVYTPK